MFGGFRNISYLCSVIKIMNSTHGKRLPDVVSRA